MINIIYCNSHKIIIGANHNCNNGLHTHIDSDGNETKEQGVLIAGIDEPNYNGSVNFVTKDGTIVNNSEEWVIYLKKYIP